LFLQMLPRKLERHELMMIAGAARRGKWFVCDGIVSAISRRIIAALAAVCAYRSVTSEIQAEFQAVRMKSAAPIKRMLGAEIVPLDCDADFVYVPVQRTPSVFQFTPRILLSCATRT